MTRGWRRPPLWGPAEAIAIRGQSGGRWEADDRRGDPAAFAVDPATFIGFLVEVQTTREKEKYRNYVQILNVHLSRLCAECIE